MDQQKIARINELYRKSKAEGLTEAEKKEQKILRTEYMDSVKRNLRSQLNNIDIEEKDGSVINLGEKYGNKKGHKKEQRRGASSRRAFFLQRCMKTPAQYAAMRLSEVKSLRKKL